MQGMENNNWENKTETHEWKQYEFNELLQRYHCLHFYHMHLLQGNKMLMTQHFELSEKNKELIKMNMTKDDIINGMKQRETEMIKNYEEIMKTNEEMMKKQMDILIKNHDEMMKKQEELLMKKQEELLMKQEELLMEQKMKKQDASHNDDLHQEMMDKKLEKVFRENFSELEGDKEHLVNKINNNISDKIASLIKLLTMSKELMKVSGKSSYRTIPCRHFNNRDCCMYGINCSYVHEIKECPYGKRCCKYDCNLHHSFKCFTSTCACRYNNPYSKFHKDRKLNTEESKKETEHIREKLENFIKSYQEDINEENLTSEEKKTNETYKEISDYVKSGKFAGKNKHQKKRWI